MKQRYVNLTLGRRVRIVAVARDVGHPRAGEPLGRLVQMHDRSCLFAEEAMGEDAFEATVADARREGESVTAVWRHDHGRVTLNAREGGDRWDSRLIGALIVPKAEATELGTAKLRAMVDEELDRLTAWINGDVYDAVLETGGRCPACTHTTWTEEDRRGRFYGSDHRKSGLYRAAGIPETGEAREKACWREEPRTTTPEDRRPLRTTEPASPGDPPWDTGNDPLNKALDELQEWSQSDGGRGDYTRLYEITHALLQSSGRR